MLANNLFDLLSAQARRTPNAPALLAPGRPTLTYAALLAQMEATVARLNALGLGRGDRVALVLPNGPELAAAFLGTAAAATAAPLNPAYTSDEFAFYLPDLQVRAIVVEQGSPSAAAAVARARGLPVIELAWEADRPAGTFTLHGLPQPLLAAGGPTRDDDTALLLHTSGTTARPKRVPRTHAGLIAGALDYHAVLGLTPEYCCLNILPLFHIHSLVSALLAPLSGGASVVVPAGFSAAHFFDWVRAFEPTWFTGGPALHQTILDLARARGETMPLPGLRFIRSGAAPLSPALLADMEQVFQVPVLEGYGLSEAVPIASNPLPPRPRKAGSVGVACGPEIGIMAPDDAVLLPSGTVGEIVVRGPSVMPAYADDPAANAEAFTGEWFRTGDEGYLDAEGYLFLTGRLKEMINYGGEKVTPAEVEAVLLSDPAVAEAAVFAVPDPVFGEAVAAAVVVRPGASLNAPGLRQRVAARLAPFKVPRRIVAVAALPRGATGKVQRRRLAEQLAPAPHAPEPPVDELEQQLARLWGQVLGGIPVGRHDNFFELGGHSLLATGLLAQLEAELERPLPASLLVGAPTVAQLAAALRHSAPSAQPECLVALQPRGSRPPFFCVHPVGGDALRFAELARRLGDDQPFYALEAVGLHDSQPPHATIEGMAEYYLEAVRAAQPRGPYYLGGYCLGGVVAFEMARQLAAQGEHTALVAIFEGHAPVRSRAGQPRWTRERLGYFLDNLPGWAAEVRALGPAYLWRRTRQMAARITGLAAGRRSVDSLPPTAARHQAVQAAHLAALRAYLPSGPYPGRVTVMNVRHQSLRLDPDPRRGWQRLALGGVAVQRLPGSHHTLLQPPQVEALAEALRASLEAARSAWLAADTHERQPA